MRMGNQEEEKNVEGHAIYFFSRSGVKIDKNYAKHFFG